MGVFKICEENKYQGSILLALGMILVSASHILSTVILTAILFFIWLGYLFFRRTKILDKTVKFILAGALVIIANLNFLINYHELGPIINQPYSFALGQFTVRYSKQIQNAIDNSMQQPSLGIFFIIICIFYLIKRKSLTKFFHILFWSLIVISLLVSSYVPWNLLNNTPIAIIQFPSRFFGFASLITAILFTEMWPSVIKRRTFIFIVIATLVGQFSSELVTYTTLAQNNQALEFKTHVTPAWIVAHMQPQNKKNVGLKSKNLQLNLDMIVLDSNITDYWPKQSVKYKQSILEQRILSNHNRAMLLTQPMQKNNKLIFNVWSQKTNQDLDLPILNYKNQYFAYANGKVIAYKNSKRGTIELKVPTNRAQILLIPKHILRDKILALISNVEFLGLIFILVWKQIRKKKI